MTKKTPKNIHFVDFKEKKRKSKPSSDRFLELSEKLESRLNGLEQDLKGNLESIEEQLHQKWNRDSFDYDVQDFRNDFKKLSQDLEARVQKSIQELLQYHAIQISKSEMGLVQKLMKEFVRFLSGDFLSGVFKRVQNETVISEIDEFGMDPKIVEYFKPLALFLYNQYWRVQTLGVENIPNSGRALVVANHSGTLPYDGFMLATAIINEHPVRDDARFLVENFVYHMPFLGSLMYRIGGVRACPENAERLLNRDHLVVVFPEGVKGIGKYFSKRYQLQRFGRGGFIKLCMKTKSPLIPVAIIGAEEIHPILFKSNSLAKLIGIPYIPITPTFPLLGLLGLIPLPTKWTIQFGKPVHFKNSKPSDIENEIKVHQESEKVRSLIQAMIDDNLKKRKSIWLG